MCHCGLYTVGQSVILVFIDLPHVHCIHIFEHYRKSLSCCRYSHFTQRPDFVFFSTGFVHTNTLYLVCLILLYMYLETSEINKTFDYLSNTV